jgi:putative hydrolase of the HAD superfamily
MVRAVIFDLDNTLMDFMKMKDDSIRGAAAGMIDAGLQMPLDEAVEEIYRIYREKGIEYQEVLDQFLLETTGRMDNRLLAAGIIAYRRSREAAMILYPHVRDTLSKLLRQGLQLAILSDAPAKQAWLRLTALGLVHFFDAVITFEDTGYRKPHAAPFLKVLEHLDLEPRDVLMVGDWMERDISGAQALGIPTVFARYGDTFDTKSSHADFQIDDIAELLNIVARLNAESGD